GQALPARRLVLALQAARVEPVLERGDRSVVLERTSVPEAPQRQHLVIAGAPPRAECQRRAGPDRLFQDVVPLAVLAQHREAVHRSQLVASVLLAAVAPRAPQPVEHRFAMGDKFPNHLRFGQVGMRWRPTGATTVPMHPTVTENRADLTWDIVHLVTCRS